jgi:FkbM family methyltransferase
MTRLFPWGNLEFTQTSALSSQYGEIFLKRHYCCGPLRDRPVIVDCGGNIGLSAIWFAQSYPGADITVYEPDASLCEILERNLSGARCTGVRVVNAAAWVSDGEIAFDATGDDSGKVDPSGKTRVRAVDLALALPERVDLLKLDIEGAEFEVLEHLLNTGSSARVNHTAVEFHPTRRSMPQMIRILGRLQESGFDIAFDSFLSPWAGLEPTASPFEAVGRQRVLLYLYAWRRM